MASTHTSTADSLAFLREHLGGQLVELMFGPGLGNVTPSDVVTPLVALRADAAARAARVVIDGFGVVTARSWFMGQNPALGGEAPALVLRDAGSEQDAAAVVAAALSVTS